MSVPDPYNRPRPDLRHTKHVSEYDAHVAIKKEETYKKCNAECPEGYWKLIAIMLGILVVGLVVNCFV